MILCCSCFPIFAQEQTVTPINLPAETPGKNRVYAELLGTATNLLGLNRNCVVTVDLGQSMEIYKTHHIIDENGKPIKFKSMVAAMNYMGERGWKFVQAYIVTVGNQNVYHWLLYKDVSDKAEIYDRLMVANTDSAPKKEKKEKHKDKDNKYKDDIY
jgi:hypothetical protein